MFKNLMISILRISVLFLVSVILTGYKSSAQADTRGAFTSILPQKDFVQCIAGKRFSVHALVGPGQDPHSFSPTPDQMARLSEAVIFFRIGVEFEEGILPKIQKSMPKLRIYDLRHGIKLRDMSEEHHHHDKDDDHDKHSDHGKHDDHDKHSDHDTHNDHGKHNHQGKDPHIWLSPRLVKQMGTTIKDALIEVDPGGRQIYEKNLAQFHRELDALTTYIKKTLTPVRGTELFVFHPAFGYFADEYGLVQKPVETGGKEPSARDLALLIEEAHEHKPKVIFVQPQFSPKSAETLAKQIGCVVVPINPLPENYIREMRNMCNTIYKGLSVK